MPRKYLPHSYIRRAPFKVYLEESAGTTRTFDAAYPTLEEAQEHAVTLSLETENPFVHIEGPSPDGTTLRWEPHELFMRGDKVSATWDVSHDPFG